MEITGELAESTAFLNGMARSILNLIEDRQRMEKVVMPLHDRIRQLEKEVRDLSEENSELRNTIEAEEDGLTDKIETLILQGLQAEGEAEKQWFLEQCAIVLKLPISAMRYGESREPFPKAMPAIW